MPENKTFLCILRVRATLLSSIQFSVRLNSGLHALFSTMHIATLPILVLDEILELLDIWDITTLSLTCKSLHNDVNPKLYRNAQTQHKCIGTWLMKIDTQPTYLQRLRKIQKCLLHNPSNAIYIREHTPISLRLLKRLWSVVPLHLKQFTILNIRQWFLDDGYEFQEAIKTIHTETVIKEISICFDTPGNDLVFEIFPSILNHFNGLRSVLLFWPVRYDRVESVRQIVKYINCPQLETLTIRGFNIEGIACPKNLLNLESFWITPFEDGGIIRHYQHPSRWVGGTVEEVVKSLKTLMDKGVKFRYGYNSVLSLLNFIYYYEREVGDVNAMVFWLLQSEYQLQKIEAKINGGDNTFSLSLDSEVRDHNNRVLKILPKLKVESGIHLTICLHPSHQASTVYLLPHNIINLEITIEDPVPLSLLANIIQRLPMLRKIKISVTLEGEFNGRCFETQVYAQQVKIADGDETEAILGSEYQYLKNEGWYVSSPSSCWYVVESPTSYPMFVSLEKEILQLCSLGTVLEDFGVEFWISGLE
jgi:F-box domain